MLPLGKVSSGNNFVSDPVEKKDSLPDVTGKSAMSVFGFGFSSGDNGAGAAACNASGAGSAGGGGTIGIC